MAVMDYAQLGKFYVSDVASDKPKGKRQGKDGRRVGKETAGGMNGSKVGMNGDAKTVWGTCFECGEQDHKNDRCPSLKRGDKMAMYRLGLGSTLQRQPCQSQKILPAGCVLLLLGKQLCRIGPFWWGDPREGSGR